MDINLLASQLQDTLCSDAVKRKSAEQFLLSIQSQKNFSLALLQIVDNGNLQMECRHSGAIRFKNFIKENWKLSEYTDSHIYQEDRDQLKSIIVDLMLKQPLILREQLSEAISIIGKEDFPAKWPNLADQLVSKFASCDFLILNGVLKTTVNLFRRYRYEIRSNALFTEIKFVIEKFGQPLLNLLNVCMEHLDKYAQDNVHLPPLYECILLISKVFYNLNCQDLPEFFEDTMKQWMDHFYILLIKDFDLLKSCDSEKAGAMEALRSQVCDILTLYARQYDEEFSIHLPRFVTAVWELLLRSGMQCQYDLLVGNAITFLAVVAAKSQYKSLFEDSNTISSLCEKVILPNMYMRDSDELQFEEDSEEYIRQDLEGSDACTRRKAACDLVKALCKSFETTVVSSFQQYLQYLLSQYAASPNEQWRCKDAALFLVSAMATQGQTEKHGVTVTIQFLDLTDFFRDHVVPELVDADVNRVPIIKADCIKFLLTFRSLLAPNLIQANCVHVARFLCSQHVVTHTYAAACLEKLMMIKINEQAVVMKEHLPPVPNFIGSFVQIFSIKESEQNDYAMKGLLRSCILLKHDLMPVLEALTKFLTDKLVSVLTYSQKPHFNHYLLECICLLIKIACKNHPAAVQTFEALLFDSIQVILQKDIVDFVPYAFQLLGVLLDEHRNDSASGEIPQSYQALFPMLLQPVLWETRSNIPALVKLLQIYILRASNFIYTSGKLQAVLGIFHKLNQSKALDHLGFQLLAFVIRVFPPAQIQSHFRQIFRLIFERLTSDKTMKYIRGMIVFFGHFLMIYSPDELIATIDNLQANMFSMVIERLFVPELRKVSAVDDRAVVAAGLTRLLCESKNLIGGQYAAMWPVLMEKLVEWMELPVEKSFSVNVDIWNEDVRFVELGTPGGSGFSQGAADSLLIFASVTPLPLPESSADPKSHLAHKLMHVDRNFVRRCIESMSQEARNCLGEYFARANLTFA